MAVVADLVPTPRDMAEAHCHKKTLGQGYQNGFEAGVAAERSRFLSAGERAEAVAHLLAAAREREEWIDMGTPLARVTELNDQMKTLRAAAAILAE